MMNWLKERKPWFQRKGKKQGQADAMEFAAAVVREAKQQQREQVSVTCGDIRKNARRHSIR
jgi:hypothetical protein